jgi:hypothetical protein
MRLSEREYEELIAKRTGIMSDINRQTDLGIGAKQIKALAEETVALRYRPQSLAGPKAVPTVKPHERGTRHGKRHGPNKTEAEYGRMLALQHPGATIHYEGITLRLKCGHAYTPDYVVQMPGGWMLLVEVKSRGKNGYRQPSYQRAKLAYDQCREEFPCFRYQWAEKQQGRWTTN